MENLELGALQEWITSAEVSEEEKKRVQEDAKRAFAAQQQVFSNQKKNKELADIVSKILKEFFHYDNVIKNLANYLDIKNLDKLKIIFLPVLEKKFSKVADYIDYLEKNLSNLSQEDKQIIYEVIKTEKIWTNWDKLRKENKHSEFLTHIETELTRILWWN